ncbi:MAG: hypothetical protein ACTS42_01995 [Candidatus Hodgkinia cicadicola]
MASYSTSRSVSSTLPFVTNFDSVVNFPAFKPILIGFPPSEGLIHLRLLQKLVP